MPTQLSLREHVPLEPVGRRALAVLLEHAGLAHCLAVVEGALEHDVAKPFDQRRMRITLAVGERVVLAMAGHPFLGDDRRREPEPEAHRERGEVVQPDAAMGLRAMQEERDADVGEVTGDDDEQDGHPPGGGQSCEMEHFEHLSVNRDQPCNL